MNPTAPAQRLAEKIISNLEGTTRIYLDKDEYGPKRDELALLIDAAIQETTKDDKELIAHLRLVNKGQCNISDQLRADLAAAKHDCGEAEKRCDVAIASWDEERERALREGKRVAALRTVAEEMAGALKLVSVRAVDELKDDPKLQPHSLIVCRLERLTPATAALASYARLQKEKTL